MQNSFKANIRSESFWVRTFFSLVFLVLFSLLDVLVWVLTISQLLFVLFSGSPNAGLQRFVDSLSQFAQQIITYVGGCESEKPFPFKDWPEPSRIYSDSVSTFNENEEAMPSPSNIMEEELSADRVDSNHASSETDAKDENNSERLT